MNSLNIFRVERSSMEAKNLHDLRADLPTLHRGAAKPRAQRKYFWIDEDPDLAPAARRETPLSAWG